MTLPLRRWSFTARSSLWFWPCTAAVVALAVTLQLLQVRPAADLTLSRLLWPGDVEAARALLQVVATAVMTATTLTFSLTIVALQLASQQFSPRLLREFARDRATQAVLALLVSTFVVALTALRGLEPDRPLPVLTLALVQAMALCSAIALLCFVGHLVRSLRVDTMMVAVHEEAAKVIVETYPELGDDRAEPRRGFPGPRGGTLVPLRRSGFVVAISPQAVAEVARRHDVLLRLGVRPGDAVVQGGPIASAWAAVDGGHVPVEELADELVGPVQLGFERTSEQDSAFGLRQLTDIAVKAISPGINDPVTCAHAVGYCADLVVRLQGRRLGEQQHLDDDGALRLITPDRSHRYYLDLVCAPIRRYGREEPLVLSALLRMLRDCATNARTDEQRADLQQQCDLVLEEMSDRLLPYDAEAVRDLGRRVSQVLAGDVDGAYADAAGETRST